MLCRARVGGHGGSSTGNVWRGFTAGKEGVPGSDRLGGDWDRWRSLRASGGQVENGNEGCETNGWRDRMGAFCPAFQNPSQDNN